MNNNPSISILSSAPTTSSFTPLSEHQSSTPATFFGAKPVLHAAFTNADALLSPRDLKSWDHWREVFSTPSSNTRSTTNGTNGTTPETHQEGDDTVESRLVYTSISGFITSDSVILFPSTTSPSGSKAISIPYPSISLHATQRIHVSSEHTYHSPSQETDQAGAPHTQQQALYLQLDLGNPHTRNPADDEDEGQTADLLIVPSTSITDPAPSTTSTSTFTSDQDATPPSQTPQGQADLVKHIFEALSRCADLHPDPASADSDEDMEDGGGMPSAGGWITSENVDEFAARFGVDGDDGESEILEDGVNSGELGPGAGTRRTRDEGEGDDEGKWQRTG